MTTWMKLPTGQFVSTNPSTTSHQASIIVDTTLPNNWNRRTTTHQFVSINEMREYLTRYHGVDPDAISSDNGSAPCLGDTITWKATKG